MPLPVGLTDRARFGGRHRKHSQKVLDEIYSLPRVPFVAGESVGIRKAGQLVKSREPRRPFFVIVSGIAGSPRGVKNPVDVSLKLIGHARPTVLPFQDAIGIR